MPKLLPQDLATERSVLGSMLVDPIAASEIFDQIGAVTEETSPFYRLAHTKIYSAGIALESKAEPIDTLTLTKELQRRGDLEAVGGAGYLVELTSEVVTTANVKSHCLLLKEKSLSRNLIAVCRETEQITYTEEQDVFQTLENAEYKISSLGNQKNNSNIHTAEELVINLQKEQEEVRAGTRSRMGITSALIDLDHLTNGWQKTDMVVIGARPSQGKNRFCFGASKGFS